MKRYAVERRGCLVEYQPRLILPENDNKYYIRKAAKGYNPAIIGYPQHRYLDVLSNCVGYAIGRFNEIGGYNECKYLKPVNAERFIDYAIPQGLKISQAPQLGACAVWQGGESSQGSDGAGHVAIVEQINDDGSIITSESGYGDKRPFWTSYRQKGKGNWGQKTGVYKFLGFILNPAIVEIPAGVDWVTIKRREGSGYEYINVPGIMKNNRWYIQLRSIDEALQVCKVSYNSEEGIPEVYK